MVVVSLELNGIGLNPVAPSPLALFIIDRACHQRG